MNRRILTSILAVLFLAGSLAVLPVIGFPYYPLRNTVLQDPYGSPPTLFFDDFETDLGWVVNPNGADTATAGQWERGDPEATNFSGPKQLDNTLSGVNALVTGRLAGAAAEANDIDGGITSIQSPAIALTGGNNYILRFSYYLAHYRNSSTEDYFKVKIISDSATTVVYAEPGKPTNRNAAWVSRAVSLNTFAGQTIRIVFEAADAGPDSLVEAAVDDVQVTR